MIIDGDTCEIRIRARGATAADAEPIAQTLANAFFGDPLISFLLQDKHSRAVGLPRLFKLLFKLGLPYGLCDMAEGCESVALWRPPISGTFQFGIISLTEPSSSVFSAFRRRRA